MFAELAHGPNVSFLRALGEAPKLETLDHSLSEFRHSYTSRVLLTRALRNWLKQRKYRRRIRKEDDQTPLKPQPCAICAQRLVQQIVGPERRERVSSLIWRGD